MTVADSRLPERGVVEGFMARRGVIRMPRYPAVRGGRGMNVYYYAQNDLTPQALAPALPKEAAQTTGQLVHTARDIRDFASLSAQPLDGLFERPDFSMLASNSRVCEDSAFPVALFLDECSRAPGS